MVDTAESIVESRLREVAADFPRWEKIKDIVDQLLDVMFNYRQSGHPGGSRSKVHMHDCPSCSPASPGGTSATPRSGSAIASSWWAGTPSR